VPHSAAADEDGAAAGSVSRAGISSIAFLPRLFRGVRGRAKLASPASIAFPISAGSQSRRRCRTCETARIGAAIAFMVGAMLTLFAALALAAQSPSVPPQATQLPPTVPPVPAPVVPVVEADMRPYVALVTDLGTITVRIEDKRAPITAANFLRYVDTKRLDGFKFYRSTKSWGPTNQLIQAGNRGDARRNFPPIAHEPTTATGLTNCKGALSMARLNPGDATSDFFLL